MMRNIETIHQGLAAQSLSGMNHLALLGPLEMQRVLPRFSNSQAAALQLVPNLQKASEEKERDFGVSPQKLKAQIQQPKFGRTVFVLPNSMRQFLRAGLQYLLIGRRS